LVKIEILPNTFDAPTSPPREISVSKSTKVPVESLEGTRSPGVEKVTSSHAKKNIDREETADVGNILPVPSSSKAVSSNEEICPAVAQVNGLTEAQTAPDTPDLQGQKI
jgi:hypothetical protein